MNILKHNNQDEGKLFRRLNWTDFQFTWYKKEQRYLYCDMNGKPKPAHYNVNAGKFSRVGLGVLESDDIIIVGEETMGKDVNYAGKNYGVVGVIHGVHEKVPKNSQEYMFKTDQKLAHGDVVVYEDKNGYGLATVSTYYENNFNNAKQISMAKAWIVDEVIMINHREKQISATRIKYIKEQLEERKASMEETAVYEILAKTDPEAKKLLKELKTLS